MMARKRNKKQLGRFTGKKFAQAAELSTSDFEQVMLETFVVNERMNQLILDNLDSRVWRTRPQGRGTRTIAAIFAHIHNVRCKWLRLSAPHLKLPARLDHARCSQKQACVALERSAALCSRMLAEGFGLRQGRVHQFLRDGWASPWKPGAAMVAYMIVHEAHHRGQICMLAHQLGFPLPSRVVSEMWAWERLWRKCGFDRPR